MSWIPWVPPGRRPPVDSKVIIVAVVAVLVVAAALLGGRREGPAPGEESVALSDTASSALPKLVDLGADKCAACKAMAPILDELRETYAGRMDVVFIDVWQNRGAAEEYRVQVIPTQIFFDPAGNELFRHQGFLSREDILAKWAELGFDFDDA
jgi:thioredoxin 1